MVNLHYGEAISSATFEYTFIRFHKPQVRVNNVEPQLISRASFNSNSGNNVEGINIYIYIYIYIYMYVCILI